jgi:hypothetical protein
MSDKAGRELDEAVCKALGIAPLARNWYASNNGGESGFIWLDTRERCVQWCREMDAKFPSGIAKGCQPYESVVYPRVSEDIAAAWSVIEALEQRGFTVRYSTTGPTGQRRVTVHRSEKNDAIYGAANADTTAHAICLAALKAINADKDG